MQENLPDREFSLLMMFSDFVSLITSLISIIIITKFIMSASIHIQQASMQFFCFFLLFFSLKFECGTYNTIYTVKREFRLPIT